MKIASRGRILSSWTPPAVEEQRRPWEGVATRPGALNIGDATNYVLSLPVSTVIIGCDNIAQVEDNVRIAREFTPLSQAQMAAIANQTAPSQDKPSSSTSKAALGTSIYRTTHRRTPGKRACSSLRTHDLDVNDEVIQSVFQLFIWTNGKIMQRN